MPYKIIDRKTYSSDFFFFNYAALAALCENNYILQIIAARTGSTKKTLSCFLYALFGVSSERRHVDDVRKLPLELETHAYGFHDITELCS